MGTLFPQFRTIFHWHGPSIKERVSLAIVDAQTGLYPLSVKGLEDQIHTSIIVEDVIHCQVQGT